MKKLFAACLFFVVITCRAQIMVKDINIGEGGSNPEGFARINNTTLFIATDGLNGYELWKTDGTEKGTMMVHNTGPGPASGCRYAEEINATSSKLVALGNQVLFFANDGQHGFELWRSDGTEFGTYLVKDIYTGPVSSSTSLQLTKAGNTVWFAANDGIHGTELWKSDGTDSGTVMVKDLYTGINSSNPQSFFTDSNLVFFTANDGKEGYGLCVSDGSSDGTIFLTVAMLNEGANGLGEGVKYNGTIYLSAGTPISTGLWKTTGTPEGTELIMPFAKDGNNSGPSGLVIFKDKLVFAANTPTYGSELWTSDGTAMGTTMLKDIYPGSKGSAPQNLTTMGDKLYFTALDTSGTGPQLWVTDLTDTGTHTLAPLLGIKESILEPRQLFKSGGRIYFCAGGIDKGCELWVTDGTAQGTQMLNEICPGRCSSDPGNFYCSDTTLFFSATDDTHGKELWKLGGAFNLMEKLTTNIDSDYTAEPFRRELTKLSHTGTDIAYLKVFNLQGEEIFTQDAEKPVPPSVETFAPGIYLLRAYDKYDRIVAFTRFIKQ
ncbi:MAG TPA: ELWxxDGT repeat protein [Chitinophagales bacterium]|nr:ELWxxDGT repeat protein [Chitinophagales bacterium]